MAKPMFCAGALPVLDEATAVFIPTTCPAESTSGPPEFPELMAASVWIMFWRVSPVPPLASPACTVRPVAEMMPEVTVGVPAERPSALPMAMTASPTWSLVESPKVTAWRLAGAELILSRAVSLEGSAPTKVAGNAAVWPYRVTVIAVAPEMTWLLVITSPVVSMIIPVPWSSTAPLKRPLAPVPGPLASIDTTSGSTLFTMVGIWAPPARAGPGVS